MGGSVIGGSTVLSCKRLRFAYTVLQSKRVDFEYVYVV